MHAPTVFYYYFSVVGNTKDLGLSVYIIIYYTILCYYTLHVDHSNYNCLIGWRKAKEFVGFSYWNIDIP